jgi:hypothetical protein
MFTDRNLTMNKSCVPLRFLLGAALLFHAHGAVLAGENPHCPPACHLPPGKEVAVNLEWRPSVEQAKVGETVEIGLYAVATTAQPPPVVAGIQFIIVWDPALLSLRDFNNFSPYEWLTSGFPNDSALDDLNHGALQDPAGTPDNDGDAIYEALADFPKPIGDGPAVIPVEGLLITTLRFDVLAKTPGTLITIPESRGQFSCTAVFIGSGKVAGCDIKQDLGSATVTTEEIPLAILGSDPPDGAVDARQSSTLDGSTLFGWDGITLHMNGAAAGVTAGDLQVTSSCTGAAPGIMSVSPKGNDVAVQFTGRIPPCFWTTVRHVPSNSTVRIGFLPGDVNADLVAGPLDILALIDHLNGLKNLPVWSTDIDRSGQTNPQDILREVDVLNGAGAFEPCQFCE